MDETRMLLLIKEAIELLCDEIDYTEKCSKCDKLEVCISLCRARNLLEYKKKEEEFEYGE